MALFIFAVFATVAAEGSPGIRKGKKTNLYDCYFRHPCQRNTHELPRSASRFSMRDLGQHQEEEVQARSARGGGERTGGAA